jgi:hypothetical protein
MVGGGWEQSHPYTKQHESAMYFVTNHNRKIAEWTAPGELEGLIDDLEPQLERNMLARKIMAEKDSGRPGHYYGRSMVIEGEIPAAAFAVAAAEFGGDPDWWKDDAKFQDYLKRHPDYSWLNG